MPRIPTHQYDDEWDDPDEFNIEDDDAQDRRGHKIPAKEHRKNRDWEEQRRDAWRKRYRDDY